MELRAISPPVIQILREKIRKENILSLTPNIHSKHHMQIIQDKYSKYNLNYFQILRVKIRKETIISLTENIHSEHHMQKIQGKLASTT